MASGNVTFAGHRGRAETGVGGEGGRWLPGSTRTDGAARPHAAVRRRPGPPELFVPRPAARRVPRRRADDPGQPDGRPGRFGQDRRGRRLVRARRRSRRPVYRRLDPRRPGRSDRRPGRGDALPRAARRSHGRRHRRRAPAVGGVPRAARRDPDGRPRLGPAAADRPARARPGADLRRPHRARSARCASTTSASTRPRPPTWCARTTPPPTADDVAAVLEQADGWAAALVLGSRALAGSADIADARAVARRDPAAGARLPAPRGLRDPARRPRRRCC